MSIDLSPRLAAGFPPVQPAAPAKTSSEAFDPFAVVRSGAVPESNRFVQALEHLYGIAEGSLTATTAAGPTTAAGSSQRPQPTPQQVAQPAETASPFTDSPLASSEISTVSALMRRAAEQNAAGLSSQSATNALLSPWAGST